MQDDVFLILGIAIIFLLALLAICVVFLVWRYRQLPNPGLFPGAPQVEHKPVQGLPPQTTPAPESGAAKTARKGSSRTGVWLLVAILSAICVGSALIVAVAGLGLTSMQLQTATTLAGPTRPPKASTGKWQTNFGASSFDDSKTVVLRLDAENPVEGWLNTYTPTLILRCKEHETDAYVKVELSASRSDRLRSQVRKFL